MMSDMTPMISPRRGGYRRNALMNVRTLFRIVRGRTKVCLLALNKSESISSGAGENDLLMKICWQEEQNDFS